LRPATPWTARPAKAESVPQPRPQTGATEADLEAVLREWHGALLRAAYRLTGNREDAEDAVQNALCQAVAALGEFRGDARLSTWLFRIVIRSAVRIASRRRPPAAESVDAMAEPEASTPTPLASLTSAEQADRLLAALQKLPWPQRLVVSLAAIDQLDRATIAEVLGIPIGTVDSRLHHGRARLRQILGLSE